MNFMMQLRFKKVGPMAGGKGKMKNIYSGVEFPHTRVKTLHVKKF